MKFAPRQRNMLLILGVWLGVAASGSAIAAPQVAKTTSNQAATRAETRQNLTVSTQRSDGAVFPQVRQRVRQQKTRLATISGSQQALPAQNTWRGNHEPASGGRFVADASESYSGGNNSPPVVLVSPRRR
jgi:TolA-binding protein